MTAASDDWDAPAKPTRAGPQGLVLPPDGPRQAIEPGAFICADHRAPDGFWATPTGWLSVDPKTSVDEAFAYAVVSIVGGVTGRFVMAGPDYSILEDWCRRKAGRDDYSRTYEIRPCSVLVLRQASRPPADLRIKSPSTRWSEKK